MLSVHGLIIHWIVVEQALKNQTCLDGDPEIDSEGDCRRDETKRNSLETASIEEEQIEPDAFGVPLHRFHLEYHWKRIAEIDGFDVKVIQNRNLDETGGRSTWPVSES